MTSLTSHVLSPCLVAVANTGRTDGPAHLQSEPSVALLSYGPATTVTGRAALEALRRAIDAALQRPEV